MLYNFYHSKFCYGKNLKAKNLVNVDNFCILSKLANFHAKIAN